jgi:DNA invertase Pin-like site-specific DNA recombinase
MRDAAGKRFDYVVIEDLDRAFRNQADYHAARNRLKFLDVELHDARGVVGLIEGSIRALQSEVYLENLAAKTHRGQTGAVTRGRHVGPPPFGYLRCSRMVETGLCDNRRTVGLEAIERQVIEAIEKHLAAPDLIAEYVREFHRELRELNEGKGRRRSDLGRRLASAEANIKRTVDLLVKGYPTRALKERLAELEAERTAIEADLAALAPPLTEFHPNVAENYRRKVADLKAALLAADEANRADAFRVIRELVERIVIQPSGPYRPVDIEIHGKLAALLKASTGAVDGTAPESRGVMVAGERNARTRSAAQPATAAPTRSPNISSRDTTTLRFRRRAPCRPCALATR